MLYCFGDDNAALKVETQVQTGNRYLRDRLLSALGFRLRRAATVPEGMRVYGVGDIHGCVSALDRLHALIADDGASFPGQNLIVYLGDYIDRGPDSRGVIERLLDHIPGGFSARFLKGNHEAALLSFLETAEIYRSWRNYGAAETLLSYGVRPPLFDSVELFEEARNALAAALPGRHLEFMHSLQLQHTVGDYAFVHAGIRPGRLLNQQREDDLLWIRDEFLGSPMVHEKVIVHGHTPVTGPQRLHNRISVDTGAYATGVLTSVVLEGTSCRFLQVGRT
jgi:serine/threonine protein phosphatase 1